MRFFSALVSLTRHRRLLVLLHLWLCAIASAQFTIGGQQPLSTYVLTGTVVNSATGAPIPYALVQIGQESKLADQNGNFHFDDLNSTSVYITAHKPGFFDEREASDIPGPATMVTLSNQPTNVTVRLVPEAVIVGHVADAEGEPIENLPVRLRHAQVMNGRRVWQQQHGTATDEDGDFRIANIKPGIYYVAVGPNFRGRMMVEDEGSTQKTEVFPVEYYPGVRDLSSAAPLRLAPGQHATIELPMKRVPAYRMSGFVTGVGTNSGGLNLLDADGEQSNIGARFDSHTGKFQIFPVPAGAYRLRFNGQDTDGQPLFADIPIMVNRDVNELHLTAQRTVSVPVEFVTVFTKQDSRQPQMGISSGPGSRMAMFYGQLHLISRTPPYQQFYSNRDKPDGPMVIRGLEPGTYDVEVNPNGMSYVASVTCAGVNLLNQPLVIAPGADPQPIEVLLRDDGASLNGLVQIPDGTSSAQVLMIAEGDAANAPRPVFVDRSGKFQAQSIAPGTYDVLAFDRLDGIEYRNREVLNEYLSHAAHVTLSADQQAKVTVDLIRTQQ